jgi:transposase
MSKYTKAIQKKITDLIEKDSYTVAEICLSVGVSERSYYGWRTNIAEFADAIQKAREIFIERNLVECDRSLTKLIKGYEFEEKKTVTIDDGAGRPKIKEQTVVKKQIAPNLGAIIHYQTNKDPDNWKNKQSTEITGKDGKDFLKPKLLTKAQAKEFLNQIDNEC